MFQMSERNGESSQVDASEAKQGTQKSNFGQFSIKYEVTSEGYLQSRRRPRPSLAPADQLDLITSGDN